MVKGHDSAKRPARKAPAIRRPSHRRLRFDRTPVGTTYPQREAAKSLWAILRRRLLEEHGVVCTACGYVPPTAGELDGHEVYSYRGGGVIRLESIQLLCWKCHHAVHLENSAYRKRDRAQWKWEEEHPLTGRRRSWSSAECRAMDAVADEAATAYREELLKHYRKVNGVTRRQCERDWENAIPPGDITGLWRANRVAWAEAVKNDPDLSRQRQLGMIKPDLGRARMDYGPFEDEMEERRARREQAVLVKLDDPEITEQWNRMTADERGEFDGPKDFATMVWPREDEGFELFPDHECPEATAMWEDTFG
jgi:hypothetical protein